MTDDSIESLWTQLEAAIGQRAPRALEELRAPASSDDLQWLRDRGVPEDWVSLWAQHDGQGVLFSSYFWMPIRGVVDTVESEHARMVSTGAAGANETLPETVLGPARALWAHDRWIPVAKDFSGESLCIDLDPAPGGTVGQLIVVTPTRVEVLADDARAWLSRLLEELDTGAWVLEGQADASDDESQRLQFSIGRLATWRIGEARQPPPLGAHDLSLIRLDPAFAREGLDLDPARVLVFCVDGELPEGSQPALTEVTVLAPSGGELTDAITVGRDATCEVLVAQGRPAEAQLKITVSLLTRPLGGDHSERAERLLQGGRYASAAIAWQGADPTDEQARCLAALGQLDDAVKVADACDPAGPLAVALRLAAGHAEEPLLKTAPPLIRARLLSALGRHDEALETLDALPAGADVHWWRAAVLEAASRADDAAAELEQAAKVEPGLHEQRVAQLRADSLRKQGGPLPASGRLEVALTDEVLVVRDVEVDGDLVSARVTLSPHEARHGRTVDLFLPDGPLAVRLPPGAGHGAQLTLRDQGNAGHTVHVEVTIAMHADWSPRSSGRHRAMTFDRWTVRVKVPTTPDERRQGGSVDVSTHTGVVNVELPAGTSVGRSTTVEGEGLVGPKDRRGDLVVVWIEA